jgi:hypothetical protein
MKVNLDFLLKKAILPKLEKPKEAANLMKSVFERGAFDWGEIAFRLDREKENYLIATYFDGELSVLYFPDFETGLANAAGQMILHSVGAIDFTILEVEEDLKTDLPISGKGRWCIWYDEEVTFFDSFKKLLKSYIANDFEDEENIEDKVEQLKSKNELSALAEFAKKRVGKKVYESMDELIRAYESSK